MKSRLFMCTAVAAATLIPALAPAKTIIVNYSTGTGFFVNRDGYILTNDHVVRECKDISVSGAVNAKAELVANSAEYDLALLRATNISTGIGYLSSMKQPLSQGDPVVIVGYPGQSWKTGKSVTSKAQILNLQGPSGEEKWMEFSDVLEKGNSGSPLLDSSGNVVGVVVAKARNYVYNVTEQREEDERRFDLAISLPVVRTFLDRHHVTYQEADSGIYQSSKTLTSKAKQFVVNVRCKLGEQVVDPL